MIRSYFMVHIIIWAIWVIYFGPENFLKFSFWIFSYFLGNLLFRNWFPKIQTLIYIRRYTTCHSQQVKHLQLLQKSSALSKKSSEHNTNTFIYRSVDNRRRWSFYKPRIVLILKKLNFHATKICLCHELKSRWNISSDLGKKTDYGFRDRPLISQG